MVYKIMKLSNSGTRRETKGPKVWKSLLMTEL